MTTTWTSEFAFSIARMWAQLVSLVQSHVYFRVNSKCAGEGENFLNT